MRLLQLRPVGRGAVAALAVSLSILALPALGAGDDGADPQALATLSGVPGVLDTSASMPTSSDSNSALTAEAGALAVDVPKDPSEGVTVDPAAGPPVNVGVPNADQAGDAVPVAPGVVVYPEAGPSAAIAVQVVAASAEAPAVDPAPADPASTDPTPTDTTATDTTPTDTTAPATDTTPTDTTPADTTPADTTATDTTPTDTAAAEPVPAADPAPAPAPAPPAATSLGGVRLMTMLQDADAPTDYAFALSLPSGGTIASDGASGYDIADASGATTLHIAAPWARDANDVALPVSYSLDGTTLTMHIDTTGATFPVVADPLLTAALPGGSAPAASTIASAPSARPAPAPAPAKPAEKPELQCAGGSSNGSVTTSCSLSVPLWAGGGGVDYESGSILVRCKNCGEDQLARLTRFYGSMLNWKVDGKCGSNCTLGRSAASQSYELTKTTVMVPQQSTCTSLVGRVLVRKSCTILVAETRTVLKTVTHYTCALNVVGGSLVKVASDTYAISAAFRLSCPDGGGSGSGSIESNDFRNAVLGL